jgi:hypothetical protein
VLLLWRSDSRPRCARQGKTRAARRRERIRSARGTAFATTTAS